MQWKCTFDSLASFWSSNNNGLFAAGPCLCDCAAWFGHADHR